MFDDFITEIQSDEIAAYNYEEEKFDFSKNFWYNIYTKVKKKLLISTFDTSPPLNKPGKCDFD